MVMANNPDPNQFKRLKYLMYFLLISTGLVVFVFVKIITNEVLTPAPTICITKSCIKAANMLIENMDLSVDPCDDFYQFTCGGYIKNARLTESKSSRTIFNDLSEKLSISIGDTLMANIAITDIESVISAKKLFKSCIDEESIEKNGEAKVINFINQLGGWPLLNNQFQLDSNHTLNTMHTMFTIGVNPLFNLYISSMPSDPRVSMIRLSQANWFLLKEYYNDSNIIAYYKKMISQIAKLMNATNPNLDQDIEALFNLEKSFALSTLNQEQRRRTTFKQISLKELNQLIPNFNWTDYITNRVFNNVTQITQDEQILVYDWDYLVNATKIFQDALVAEKKTLDNMMIWSLVRSAMTFLPKKYNNVYNDFKRSYNSDKLSDSRILACVNYMTDAMPFIVGRLYVEKNFDRESKDTAAVLIENIKNEFRAMLFENDWMDYMSRKAAVEKVDTIDAKIGYPEYTFIDYHLNYLYKDYHFDEKEYFENALLVSKQQVLADIKELHKPVNLKDWKMSPAEVNAYYSATANEICFPAGILQQPFFDSDNPKYLNYGGIGTVIGHEITHGFDDRGRLYDKRGVYHPDGSALWSNLTIENYKTKAQCIIDQYSSFSLKQINKTINGYQTQGENIADNGGIKEAFRAYKRWSSRLREPEPLLPGLNFTQEQLFFINYGQVWCGKWTPKYLLKSVFSHVHSNGEFRVIGATSNIESFAQVFNCTSNKRNNPKKKCSVW